MVSVVGLATVVAGEVWDGEARVWRGEGGQWVEHIKDWVEFIQISHFSF